MTKKKAVILIDGSNFYFKLKDIGLQNMIEIDLSNFLEKISSKCQLVKSIYYIGKIRTDKSSKTKKLHSQQQKLFSHLKKHNIKYSLGYLLKSNGRYHEKGVDVKMAVDILVSTYENECDHFFLISSDTDLLPAIRKAKQKKKTVEYVGFSHQPSIALVANCNSSRLLTKEDISPFLIKIEKNHENHR